MRTVEDHHVDRLDVEAWQHVKLTSTNRSTGLINTHTGKRRPLLLCPGLVVMARVPHPIPSRTRP